MKKFILAFLFITALTSISQTMDTQPKNLFESIPNDAQNIIFDLIYQDIKHDMNIKLKKIKSYCEDIKNWDTNNPWLNDEMSYEKNPEYYHLIEKTTNIENFEMTFLMNASILSEMYKQDFNLQNPEWFALTFNMTSLNLTHRPNLYLHMIYTSYPLGLTSTFRDDISKIFNTDNKNDSALLNLAITACEHLKKYRLVCKNFNEIIMKREDFKIYIKPAQEVTINEPKADMKKSNILKKIRKKTKKILNTIKK